MPMQNFQEQNSPSGISIQTFQQIVKGDIITYRLPLAMRPTNPLREWHGRVEVVNQQEGVVVTVLDEGYVGEKEFVKKTEILAVAKSAT
jgi:ribosomal protein L21E